MDINLSDKVPPHSIESEQAVLGAILLDWDSMSEVVTTLKPEKFYSLQNQLIYEALFKLFTKNIKGDTLSLINKLTEDGKSILMQEVTRLENLVSNAKSILGDIENHFS